MVVAAGLATGLGIFLFKARELGYTDAAIGTLRTFSAAADAYRSSHPDKGYPETLEELCASGGIDEAHHDGKYSNYRYTYATKRSRVGGRIDGYEVHADPADGREALHFFVDQSGVIRHNESTPANEYSPPL